MRVIIGCDHGGFPLKEALALFLVNEGHKFNDLGCYSYDSVDYPHYAQKVAKAVLSGEYDRGLLLCGTGLGMCIAANRFADIRAVAVSDVFSARMSRLHNDSNILCLGSRVVGIGLAIHILKTWLETEFEGERHIRRLEMIETV